MRERKRICHIGGYTPDLSLDRLEEALTAKIVEAEEVTVFSMTLKRGDPETYGLFRKIFSFLLYGPPPSKAENIVCEYLVDLKVRTADSLWHEFKNGELRVHPENSHLSGTFFLDNCKNNGVELERVQIDVESLGMEPIHKFRIIR